MIDRHLRHFSTGELAAHQWVAAWKKQGFDVQKGLAASQPLLHFITDAGWEGVVDLVCWFSHRVPQSAGLASSAWTPAQLETLFVDCDRPLAGLPAALNYQRVESKGILPATFITTDLYAPLTPQGRVWILDFPVQSAREGAVPECDVSHIPLFIQFQLGSSLISLALLRQLQSGDVVLVNQVKNVVLSHGNALGQFIITEEGFMFDENHDQVTSDHVMGTTPVVGEHQEDVQPLASRNSVKVRLDVVLQQSTLSIAELEAFYRGQVMPCTPEAQQNVMLAVNGVSIAKGELIWIEDRLGVEITDIYQEVGNVCR